MAKSAIRLRPAEILVGSMFVAYLLNYCDRQAIFSIYPILKSELHFSDTELGLIGSAFSFIYGLASPIAGQIGDRFSQKSLVILSLVLWSFFTFLTGLATSVIMLLACRALIGISESLYMPAAISLTGSAYPPRSRSRAVGILKTAQIFGVIAGGWFGGVMADRGQWRAAFFVLGAVGIAYALPYWFCLRQYRQPIYAETRRSGSLLAVTALIRIPSYLLIGAVFAVESFGLWLLYAWLPTFFREKFSLGMADAALSATVCLQAATFAGIVSGGWIADHLSVRRPFARLELIAWGMILCVPCFHLLGHCDSLAGTKLAAVGLGLGTGWVMANVFSAAFDVVPVDTRASSVGFLNLFSAVGAGLGPLLGGLWKQSLGIGNLMTLTGGAYAVAGLLMLAGTKIWFERDYARVH
jgi:MFS family permease